jgi:hypothetical protein
MAPWDLPLSLNRILYCLYYLNDREYCERIGFTPTWLWYFLDLWNSIGSEHFVKFTLWYYAIDKRLAEQGIDSNVVLCIVVTLLVATILVVLVKLVKYLWTLVETVVIVFAKLCVIALISLAVNVAWDFYMKPQYRRTNVRDWNDMGEWE